VGTPRIAGLPVAEATVHTNDGVAASLTRSAVLASSHRPRICLVTSLHPSLNPRLVKEADALSGAGYEVIVIAPDFSPWARAADAVYQNRCWRIVERPRFGPHAPAGTRVIELVRRLIADIATRHLGLTNHVLVRAACHPASPALVSRTLRHKADLYIAHVLPALPAAALAARMHGALYAFDAEDFHLGEPPPGPEHDRERQIVKAMEAPFLAGCAYVTAASPGIAQAYADVYGIPLPQSVLNVFPLRQAPAKPSPKGSAAPGPSIHWYSQTIGADRGLQCAVQAIGRSRMRPHLYLRGTPTPGFLERLRREAQAIGVADHLHVLEPSLPHDLERLASQYDAGLCGEIGHTENRRIALTNKQFSYLLAGIPALMSDIPAHRAFAREAAGAVELYEVDDPESLARAMDAVLANPDRLAAMRDEAWRLGQTRFNWDIEQKHLLNIVERTLGQALRGDSCQSTSRAAEKPCS